MTPGSCAGTVHSTSVAEIARASFTSPSNMHATLPKVSVPSPVNVTRFPPAVGPNSGAAAITSGMGRTWNVGAGPSPPVIKLIPGVTLTRRQPGTAAGVVHIIDVDVALDATGAIVPN